MTKICDVIDNLDLESLRVLLQGFWPCARQTFEVQIIHNDDGHIKEEFDEDDPYIGSCSGRPLPSF